MRAREFNFDGIVGPTHNYAGLSFGNVASATHKDQVSNPRAAALQGLEKMRANFELGIGQAVLPPPRRPRFDFLRSVGFHGSDSEIVRETSRSNPSLLAVAYSAASMWTANAATVSPSSDCADGKVHLTPANLASTLHRAIECDTTTNVLRHIFANHDFFEVHEPLPTMNAYSDEGAANHSRLCSEYGATGIEIFTYGRSALDRSKIGPQSFPARQTLEACEAIARIHQCDFGNTFFVQQTAEAIDAGVFHNDVISVGNQNVLLLHEKAFVDQADFIDRLSARFEAVTGQPLHVVEIDERTLPLSDAVSSYLFNSQLLTHAPGKMMLVCPSDCELIPAARAAIEKTIAENNPICDVRYFDLKQSMNNGGGPACLRLRVVLNEQQAAAVHPGVIFSTQLYEQLGNWITKNYRESLAAEDLKDPQLAVESGKAIRELEAILEFPANLLGS